MSEVKTAIWASALIRRAESAGAAAFLVRRGDEDAGSVIVKVARLDRTADLYVPARSMEGERVWTQPLGGQMPEMKADEYWRRRAEDDPDLWVIEVEDRHGRHFLSEPVEDF